MAAAVCGVSMGALAACYPGAILAEPAPPGALAATFLGAVGVLLLAPLWLIALAAHVTAPREASGMRSAAFVAGAAQFDIRAAEARHITAVTVLASFSGAVGGLIAVAGQSWRSHHWSPLTHLAPTIHTWLLGAVIASICAVVGGALSLAAGGAAVALIVSYGGLVVTLLFTGAAYFATSLQSVASLMPGSVLLVVSRDHLTAPQFTSTTSASLSWTSTAVWLGACFFFAIRRTMREVR